MREQPYRQRRIDRLVQIVSGITLNPTTDPSGIQHRVAYAIAILNEIEKRVS